LPISRWHVHRKALTKQLIPTDEVQFVIEVPLKTESGTVLVEAVGTPAWANSAQILRSEHLKHLKSAQVLLDYTWAFTANGTIQVYDETAAAVLAETVLFSGGEADDDLIVDVTGTLVAGNRIVVRANVTVAGGTGETATLNRAILKLICGVS